MADRSPEDKLLYDELKREGYESCLDYCLKNWNSLTLHEKQLLVAVGVKPPEN